MAFTVHRSNALERLVDTLARVVQSRAGEPDPLRPEPVVVQSRALERWLSQQLARRLGVWANPRFPFPRRVVDEILAATLGGEGGAAPEAGIFREDRLVWAIARHLPEALAEDPEAFAPIRRYLEADGEPGPGGPGRLIPLAGQIAALFDRYAVYRPELVSAWDRQAPDEWQGRLWHRLSRAYGAEHVAARATACYHALGAASVRPDGLPPRLHLFAVRTLPPLFLRLFAAVSRVCEIHLYHLTPCREFWGDVQRADRHAAELGVNPLLASLGRLGRDFQALLEEHVPEHVTGQETYVETPDDAPPGTVLERLQQDILEFRHRRPGGTDAPVRLAPDDDSVAIHSCFSPMREVEVLRDQLLARFAAQPDLRPHEVVVMTPAIETYAPYVEAVFGVDPEDPTYLPYTVADRNPRVTHRGIDAFLSLLELLSTRLTAPEVMELLAREPVRVRFGVAPQELEILSGWIDAAGIRWGEDERDREALGQPPWREFTWRFGLDRLLLGYAAGGDGWTTFQGVLPCRDVGGDPALLGKLAELAEALFEARQVVAEAAPLPVWRDRLGRLLERFVDDGEGRAWQHQAVRDVLSSLAEDAAAAGFAGALDLETVRSLVAGRLDTPAPPREFLAGGITFCAMVPMRSVPFRVVALLGLNDEDFPRRDHRAAFDLMAERYRPGDRSVRDDDRYQFLEALLSAREHLLCTYVGQSIADGSALPPSVVVSELLDVVGETCEIAAAQGEVPTPPRTGEDRPRAARQRLVTHHPLHPFDPRYFVPPEGGDPGLFSYSAAHLQGARGLVGPRETPEPFLPGPLPPPAEVPPELELDGLIQFLCHPGPTLARERIGLRVLREETPLSDREPIELEPLDRYQVREALLERRLTAGSLQGAREAITADGRLALGSVGRADYETEARAVQGEAAVLAPWLAEPALDPVAVQIEAGSRVLSGWLPRLHPRAQLLYRPGRLKPEFQLRGWVCHLALCALGRPELPRTTVLVGSDASLPGRVDTVRFPHLPRHRAQAVLADLVHLYEIGQQVPLRLFPRSSFAFAEAAADLDKARRAAAQTWHSGFREGEDADPVLARLFEGAEPLTEPDAPGPEGHADPDLAFERLALRVYGPLLEARREGEP